MLSASPNLGILVLDPLASGALTRSGNGSIIVSNGDIVVDSSSTSAGNLSGNGNLSANNIDVTGKLLKSGNGKVLGTLNTGSPSLADPLAALPQPTAPAIVATNKVISNATAVLNPGTYVNGITILGNSTVVLNPGLYYLKGGGFNVNGNSKITGTGVTIFNAPIKSTDAINIAGNTSVTLSGPTSGLYQGIIIFQSRTSNVPITFAAAGMKLTGEVYAADAALNISGNILDTAVGNGATIPGALIVRDLTTSGNGNLDVVANVGGLTGDLSITKTDNVAGVYAAGGQIIYTIIVANSGPSEAVGATVTDQLPTSMFASDTFTITNTTGGAVDLTNPAGLTGAGIVNNINDIVDLPVGGTITYQVNATISAAVIGELSNTTMVSAPIEFTDSNTTNNSATDYDTPLSFSSDNWSGYAIDQGGAKVRSVGGTWTLPKSITSTGTGRSGMTIWVGIDGDTKLDKNSVTVEQTGLAWESGVWTPWIEFFGDETPVVPATIPTTFIHGPYYGQTNITAANFPGTNAPNWNISNGDEISASVVWNADPSNTSSSFTFTFEDVTSGQTWNDQLSTKYIKALRTTGEWIAETFGVGTSAAGGSRLVSLAAYGTAQFSGCWATVGGSTGPITAFTNQKINLADTGYPKDTGGGVANTGSVTNSSTSGFDEGSGASASFSVTYVNFLNDGAMNGPSIAASDSALNGATSNNGISSGAVSINALSNSLPAIGTLASGVMSTSPPSSAITVAPEPTPAAIDNWFHAWNGESIRAVMYSGERDTDDANASDSVSTGADGNTGSDTPPNYYRKVSAGDSSENSSIAFDILTIADGSRGLYGITDDIGSASNATTGNAANLTPDTDETPNAGSVATRSDADTPS